MNGSFPSGVCVCEPYKSYAPACTLVDRCHFPPIFLAFVRIFFYVCEYKSTYANTYATSGGFWSALKLNFTAHSLQFFPFFLPIRERNLNGICNAGIGHKKECVNVCVCVVEAEKRLLNLVEGENSNLSS